MSITKEKKSEFFSVCLEQTLSMNDDIFGLSTYE